jgi:hypothetical protein
VGPPGARSPRTGSSSAAGYVSSAMPPTLLVRCRAWVRVLPADAAFGLETAAALLGAPVDPLDVVQVVLRPRPVLPRRSGLAVHVRDLGVDDVTGLGGVRVTAGRRPSSTWPRGCRPRSWWQPATPCCGPAGSQQAPSSHGWHGGRAGRGRPRPRLRPAADSGRTVPTGQPGPLLADRRRSSSRGGHPDPRPARARGGPRRPRLRATEGGAGVRGASARRSGPVRP